MKPPYQTRHPAAKGRKAALSSVRIIAGQWRSRRLQFCPAEGLRPSGDRQRESVFNWLQPVIGGARCLDLFAGSGALGFEAASRGAASVQLVELQPAVARQLQGQIDAFSAKSLIHLYTGSALEYLAQAPSGPLEADVVFIDPPFAAALWQPCLAGLFERGLSAGSLIYLEAPPKQALQWPSHCQLEREKAFGESVARLLRVGEPAPA